MQRWLFFAANPLVELVDRRVSLHGLSTGGTQQTLKERRIHRLDEMLVDPRFHRALPIAFIACPGDGDDPHMRQARFRSQSLRDRKSVQSRQPDIEQHDLRANPDRQLDRTMAIRGYLQRPGCRPRPQFAVGQSCGARENASPAGRRNVSGIHDPPAAGNMPAPPKRHISGPGRLRRVVYRIQLVAAR